MLVTVDGDAEMVTFLAGQQRLGTRLWLVDSPTRVQAATHLPEVGRRIAGVLGTPRGAACAIGTGVE